ncbi:glycosyltransferase family protein [Flavobacterium phycosphaerae]|uniref:glycosyltransferase family 4 protein n=1 Tax=Flavobacterium phycosphaerae TaxID=2697515 RepID=UPI00138A00A3|nr:glycosyltransferase family 4 protein [Flavobacterium phycosphaerae]
MKILVISESINVEDSSGSKVNVALISNLKKAGFQLKVLHYSHKKIDLEDIECVLIKENKFSLNYVLSRAVRVFQRNTKMYINTYLEKVFGFSFTHTNDTNSIKRGIKKHLGFNPDLVLTLSKGSSFRPHRAMLKLPELHQKWMAYIHDPYPFHMYPRPYNWVEKSYEVKEAFVSAITQKSAHLAFPSLLLKEWMESYFPSVANKSVIIPHQIKTETQTAPLPDFFTRNEFSLLHAGHLLKQRNPVFLIEGFLRFLDNHPSARSEAKLYLIGSHSYHEPVLKPYFNHPNISIKDYLEYKVVQALEKEVPINIILEAVSEISPFLPGKFPNCVVANKPILILGPYYSEVKRLLGHQYPYWSEANDVMAIEKNISELYTIWKNNPEELRLNRQDLIDYSTEVNLKQTLDKILLK